MISINVTKNQITFLHWTIEKKKKNPAIQGTVLVYAYLSNRKQGHKRDADEWWSWEKRRSLGVQIDQERSLLFLCSIITAFLCQLSPFRYFAASSKLSFTGVFVWTLVLLSSRPVLLLCLCWHMNTCGVKSMDVKTLDDLQREYDVCAGKGPWRMFKGSLH